MKTMETMKTSIGTNNWGMVDHMVGGVGGDVLLDRNLGNMVDLVVNLISNLVNHRGGSNSNGSSMNNWGSIDNCRCRCIDTSNQTMSKKTMPKKAMSIKTTGNDLSISISSGGSKATGNKGRQNNKESHIDCTESISTIPM